VVGEHAPASSAPCTSGDQESLERGMNPPGWFVDRQITRPPGGAHTPLPLWRARDASADPVTGLRLGGWPQPSRLRLAARRRSCGMRSLPVASADWNARYSLSTAGVGRNWNGSTSLRRGGSASSPQRPPRLEALQALPKRRTRNRGPAQASDERCLSSRRREPGHGIEWVCSGDGGGGACVP
jgi:hypothetical protein